MGREQVVLAQGCLPRQTRIFRPRPYGGLPSCCQIPFYQPKSQAEDADGRFEIAGVPRKVIEAFSTRCAEFEVAMAARELGTPAANQRLAQRAAPMTRAHKREVDSEALRGAENWEKQAVDLGFDARALAAEAIGKGSSAPHSPA